MYIFLDPVLVNDMQTPSPPSRRVFFILSQKIRYDDNDPSFCIHELYYFCAILIFESWSILDLTVVNSALELTENSGRDFTNLIQTLSILKHTGVQGHSSYGRCFYLQISAKCWIHYKRENTITIIFQTLWIAHKKTHVYKNSYQNIVHLLR